MKPFSLLVKPVGGECNLRCRYCFYSGHPGGRMKPELFERMLASYAALPFAAKSVVLQGGEPLLADRAAPVFAFANQLPRPDAQALVRKDSERAFGDGKVQATWRFFFSLASSATWRQNLLDVPFDEEIQYSEDVAWAWQNSRLEKDPVKVVYCPNARVEHSHNYTLRELAKRFRGEGVADRVIFGDRPTFLREMMSAARETLRDWAYLIPRPKGWLEIPVAPVRRLVQRLSHWRGTRIGS